MNENGEKLRAALKAKMTMRTPSADGYSD